MRVRTEAEKKGTRINLKKNKDGKIKISEVNLINLFEPFYCKFTISTDADHQAKCENDDNCQHPGLQFLKNKFDYNRLKIIIKDNLPGWAGKRCERSIPRHPDKFVCLGPFGCTHSSPLGYNNLLEVLEQKFNSSLTDKSVDKDKRICD